MPRANRYHISGYIWHITHRCHKKEFLLKFARDRRRWIRWLFEARKRYGLIVLNHMVTSNHIHLIVADGDDDSTIARSMQLVAGRTAQEYNLRKKRQGAFWEDRYHATAVESGKHLRRCMAYVDLNMLRTGVISRAHEWECCGYREIQQPPKRYQVIDREYAADALEYSSVSELVSAQKLWVESFPAEYGIRDEQWSESLAVGSDSYSQTVKERLGSRGRHREVRADSQAYQLKETSVAYNGNSGPEIAALNPNNTRSWRPSC